MNRYLIIAAIALPTSLMAGVLAYGLGSHISERLHIELEQIEERKGM